MEREQSNERRRVLRDLLRLGGISGVTVGAGLWLKIRQAAPGPEPVRPVRRNLAVPAAAGLPEIVVAQGEDPRQLVRRAVAELGGIGRFVARGDVVAIKPNASWDRTPEQAANTNPDVVAEAARLCLEAGARRVMVADVSINEPQRSFARSGIGEAARRAGAEVILPGESAFREVDLRGEVLGTWQVFEPFLVADKVINIPVAKHHSLTGVTLGIKSWYGILGGGRQGLHQRIHESLADLASFMRPTLTIIDAYRVLLRGGPSGGSLADVSLRMSLIAGTDPVALDAYAAKAYWNLDGRSLRYLTLASERGLGRLDFEKLRTSSVTV
jgi:uncharacterized protein (DUF362 family)